MRKPEFLGEELPAFALARGSCEVSFRRRKGAQMPVTGKKGRFTRAGPPRHLDDGVAQFRDALAGLRGNGEPTRWRCDIPRQIHLDIEIEASVAPMDWILTLLTC